AQSLHGGSDEGLWRRDEKSWTALPGRGARDADGRGRGAGARGPHYRAKSGQSGVEAHAPAGLLRPGAAADGTGHPMARDGRWPASLPPIIAATIVHTTIGEKNASGVRSQSRRVSAG